jgi:hypothetical protein
MSVGAIPRESSSVSVGDLWPDIANSQGATDEGALRSLSKQTTLFLFINYVFITVVGEKQKKNLTMLKS